MILKMCREISIKKLVNKHKICFKTKKSHYLKTISFYYSRLQTSFLEITSFNLALSLISNNIRSTCYIIFKSISIKGVEKSMHMKISSKNLIQIFLLRNQLVNAQNKITDRSCGISNEAYSVKPM